MAASRPRAGAAARAAFLATAAPASGTTMPPVSSPAASTAPAGARMSRHTVTAPPPTRAAARTGVTPRMNRSWVASTSEISRASRSPDRNTAAPAGASVSSRRQIPTRTWASTRNATSWEASRSRYRDTPRPMLSARTATTATEIPMMAGCSDARASRKPETASSATPKPVAAAPAATAPSSRPRSGRAMPSSRSSGGRPSRGRPAVTGRAVMGRPPRRAGRPAGTRSPRACRRG